MTSRVLVGVGVAVVGIAAVSAQNQPAAPSNLQAPQNPKYADVIATCKTPPPARGGGPPAAGRAGAEGGRRGTGRAAAGQARGGAPPAAGQARGAAPPAQAEYSVTGIPGVIAAGQRWAAVWQTTGNNADGIIAADGGGLLIAQNDNGLVLTLDAKGQVSPAYRDTNTGGALARSSTGALFVASRGLNNAVLQLAPQRRVHANRYNGDPLDCLGGVVNDVTADGRGGVYFTMGGLFYADPKGQVTAYGDNLRTNGVILSPDEQTLYVTNGQSIAAFDVRADGSLTNQREFGRLPAGGGDGMAVDADGRLYVTAGGGGGGAGAPQGVHVFASDGTHLGHIPAPRSLITVAFAGPEKKTMYAVANDRVRVDVYSIATIAQGYNGRAK